MKALCLVLVVCFVGCGGGATYKPECATSTECSPTQACNDGKCILRECTVSTDCTGSQKCDLGVCIDQECWSDNDCPLTFKCADGVCVEKPECIKDEECDIAQGLFCLEYKCVPYISQDQCNGLTCTGDCSSCGMLTYCYEGTCQDACKVRYDLSNSAHDAACDGKDSCDSCYCWNHGQLDWSESQHTCIEFYILPCSKGGAEGSKATMGEFDWEAEKNGFASQCD